MRNGGNDNDGGVRLRRCHGVSADHWWHTLQQAIGALHSPERRKQLGLAKLPEPGLALCDDPDCRRLNRRAASDEPRIATYVIAEYLAPVIPANADNEWERRICDGHPCAVGKRLCEFCARVATAKRMIDLQERRR